MDAVKAFNAELSSLYEVKPPISKAKMTAITRGAIKAIKFYKHVVQSVEKFILKCKTEYKVPGLYVIDSIVRQSRHQFGADKDVFAPRFAKNMRQTFLNLFVCPQEDKCKIIRVLNLWQKNQVFAPDVIQPLFDLADPNNPIHKELEAQQANGGSAAAGAKGSPALQKTPTKGSQQGIDGGHLGGTNLNLSDQNVIAQIQQLQRLLMRDQSTKQETPVHFDRKLLDYDYGDDDDEAHSSSPKQQPQDTVTNLLTNPEVLRHLQTIQQSMAGGPTSELDMDKLRKLQEMKQQEEEFDKHLAQTVPNLPFAAECEFKPTSTIFPFYLPPGADLSQPPPGYKNSPPPPHPPADPDVQFVAASPPRRSPPPHHAPTEVITLHDASRSPTPAYARRRRSRSRDRRRSRRSRSRSKQRRHRTRSPRDRDRRGAARGETERERERAKRGLPTIRKENLSVCSTTLWVGHLSKLVHQEDLSNTFGEFGDIVSIDLIPPRGCAFIVMHRRQDATRCLVKLKNHLMHGKAITLAWAPGKGVKGKDLKDYWEGDLGVSYIPFNKIKPDIDLELLEDGGMVDEETMPTWMKSKLHSIAAPKTSTVAAPAQLPLLQLDAIFQPPPNPAAGAAHQQQASDQLDTSQPPPISNAPLLQPPPINLPPMVNPFNRLLVGMNLQSQMMSNVPIGVPPPMMHLGGSPFQQMQMAGGGGGDGNELKTLSESLMNMTQPFGGMMAAPPILSQQQQQGDDNMDIEMEDAEKMVERPLLLSEQLQASIGQFRRNSIEIVGDPSDMDARGRNEGRRHSRERNRDRDNRSRNSNYSNERPPRWSNDPHHPPHPNHEPPIDRRDREKTLNDRLQQMAMANEDQSSAAVAAYPHEPGLVPPPPSSPLMPHLGPPSLLDRRLFPPPPPNSNHSNNSLDDHYMHAQHPPPPPDEFNDGPPLLLDEYNGPHPHHNHLPHPHHHHPMDEYGNSYRMHPRDEYDDHDRWGGGGNRRDYRDGGGRNRLPLPLPPPPPPPNEFYGGGFNNGGRRGGGMRRGGPLPPPPRGGGWNDRFNGPSGGRFEPDFHRGMPIGPPNAMYDDGGPLPPPLPPPPHHHRRGGGGGRFEDRRRSRSRSNEMINGPPPSVVVPPSVRFEKRSRWGGNESPKTNDNNNGTIVTDECVSPQIEVKLNSGGGGGGGGGSSVESNVIPPLSSEEVVIKGGHTPLHDEVQQRDETTNGLSGSEEMNSVQEVVIEDCGGSKQDGD